MIYFFVAFGLSVVCTLLVRKLALRLEIVDSPDGERKLHTKTVPLLGGIALYISFWSVVFYIARFTSLFEPNISMRQLVGVCVASLVLVCMGAIDDRQSLPPGVRLLVTAVAACIVLLSGVGLEKITNPFGPAFNLAGIGLSLPFTEAIVSLGSILVFFWLMGMMYTTKILDGLDGLATGIVLIGTIMIYALTRTVKFFQPDVGILALVFAGVLFGFLLFNFHPARIFLGEGGSIFIGLILGVLAVISGGKIATALLVMAVPILDLARVIFVRLRHGRSIFQGDREHLHFRLRDAGFSERTAVLFLYGAALVFGATTLFLQSKMKLLTLGFLGLAMIVVGIWLSRAKPTHHGI